MKRIGMILILCVAIQHCLAQNNPFNAKDSVLINGKVEGFKSSQENHFITFSTYDILGRSTARAVQLANDGSFGVKLYQAFEGDILLNYKDEFIPLYVKPAGAIRLTIVDSKVNHAKGSEGAFVASGTLEEINNLIFKFETAFNQHLFKLSINMSDKAQSDSLFAAQTINALNEQLDYLNLYVRTHNITNQTFIDWQRNKLQYAAGWAVLFHPFAGKFNMEITQKQLLHLVDAIPINNPSAFNTSAYYGFLRILGSDQQIIFNINPIYLAVKNEQQGNTVPLSLNEIDSYANGLTKEVLYYINYKQRASNLADPNSFWERFDGIITNPYLKEQLLAGRSIENFKSFGIIDRLKTQEINAVLKHKLIDLFYNFKGQNLYIDFWGDWCGPCMGEMPDYPKLIAALKNKPIKFVFLSAFTTKQSMLAIKEKYQIKGDFINLSKDEVAVLNNAFEFHSYPTHFILNTKGKVISRPNKGEPAQRIKEIETILLQQ